MNNEAGAVKKLFSENMFPAYGLISFLLIVRSNIQPHILWVDKYNL